MSVVIKQIPCGYGPEDIALSTFGNITRVVISCTKMKFILHVLFGLQAPGAVYEYNMQNGELLPLTNGFKNRNNNSSTALRVEDDLYISQTRDNFILRVQNIVTN